MSNQQKMNAQNQGDHRETKTNKNSNKNNQDEITNEKKC